MEKPKITKGDAASQRAYARWHYSQNKDEYKQRARVFTDVKRYEHKIAVYEYLLRHPCVDCGEKDPIVLDFDHKPGTTKLYNVCDARRSGVSITTLWEEIEKCEVRCANCHRRITHRRRQEKTERARHTPSSCHVL